jgi:predicted nucleic acid-binding protein
MIESLVLDTSVIVKWLNDQNESNLLPADLLLKNTVEKKIICFTPELAKYEVGNALSVGKKLKPHQVKACLSVLYSLPITFVPETNNLSHLTAELVSRLHITYYDASFLALTRDHDAVLVTDNIKHQKHPKIKVISLVDYQ